MGNNFENKLIEVCTECGTASCCHGEFMCVESRNASIEMKTVEELRKLGLESPDNWSDENMRKIHGDVAPCGYKEDDGKNELVENLKESTKTTDRLKKLTNKELSEILLETVWVDFNITSPESDLIGEIIKRLKSRSCFLYADADKSCQALKDREKELQRNTMFENAKKIGKEIKVDKTI